MANQGSIVNLKQNVNDNIYTNTTKFITGDKLNAILQNLIDTLGLGVKDFFNVNKYTESGNAYSNETNARSDVPLDAKKPGLVITYLLADGWRIDQFIGSDVTDWTTSTNWKTIGPITITVNNTLGGHDLSFGGNSYQMLGEAAFNYINLEIGNKLSKIENLTIGTDLWIPIKGIFKNGEKYLVDIVLSDGASASAGEFVIFQDNTNLGYKSAGENIPITLTADCTEIKLYLYRNRIISSGKCTFRIKKDDSLQSQIDECNADIQTLQELLKVNVDVAFSIANNYVEYTDGHLVSNVNYESSDYVPIPPSKDITFKIPYGSGWAGIAFYNSTKTYISGVGLNGHSTGDIMTITTPSNATYFRICRLNNTDFYMFYYGEPVAEDKTYCNYKGREMSLFDKCVCIGDSLTAGVVNITNPTPGYTTKAKYAFPQQLQKLSGITTVNKGISGDASFEWYAAEYGQDYSGYDCAIIQLGVNDAIRNMADYGTAWNERSDTAFTNIVNMLKTANPKIKIFVATIIPALSYMDAKYIAASQAIRDWHANLNDPDVILVDLAQYGHTADSIAYNCGHLSAFGYWVLAQDYYSIISYYMNTHKDEFRQVQFIGTNQSYED